MINKVQKIRNYKPEEDFYADTMEKETQSRTLESFNREKGVFTNAYSNGLNSEKSIFDKTAVFHTKAEKL